MPAAPLIIAGLLVALMLIPASLWRHPSVDAVYRGFDPNLIYVSPGGGVSVSTDQLTLTPNPGADAFVHLVTTPVSYRAAFDVFIGSETPGSAPLRIEIWSPATAAGYRLTFDPVAHTLFDETVSDATQGPELAGGTTRLHRILGSYAPGVLYHVMLTVDQSAHMITTRVTGGSLDASTSIGHADAPDLFSGFRPTLTLSASGSSTVTVSSYEVSLPSQAANTAEATVKVDDPVARALSWAGWLASIALTLILITALVRRSRWRPTVLGRLRPRIVAIACAIGLAYLLGNFLLFPIGSLHFDVYAAKVWSYVASTYGFGDLYDRTLLVPAAAPWQGIPIHEATFPYGVTKAYYYLVVGWIHGTLLSPGDHDIAASFSYEQLLKGLNVLLGLVDGWLVYLIARPLVRRRAAVWSAILVALNPALIFVMSIWGSTESISLFFVLASIVLAERARPLGAFLMLAAAAYTRPQMLVLAFLLGIVYLRKFGAGRSVNAVAWTVIVSFVFIGPFAIAVSPSLPVDYIVRTFAYHIGNGQADVTYLGISPGHYSIWTIPLLFVSGAHGLERMWSPSTMSLAGGLTYGTAGAAISIGLLVCVGAFLLFSPSIPAEPWRYLAVVAFGMLGWLLVTPGVISRYLIYAAVLVILCRRALSLVGYVGAVGVLSATALAGIYVQIALDFEGYSAGANVLSPLNNPVSRTLFDVLSSDRFISLGSFSNIAVLIGLGLVVLAGMRSAPAAALQPSARTT